MKNLYSPFSFFFIIFFISKKYLLKKRKAPLSTHEVYTRAAKAAHKKKDEPKTSPQKPKILKPKPSRSM
jgi:hypothetical protein